MNTTYKEDNNLYDSNSLSKYWDNAIGLQKVDNLNPSKYLLELKNKHIAGELKYEEVEKILTEYYENNKTTNKLEKECDIVATRIVKLLCDNAFSFSPEMLKFIHSYLFKDILEDKNWVGNYRVVNITKDEDILFGKSVMYAPYNMIKESLNYDFNEFENKICLNDKNKFIEQFTKFISRIWQVHPFREGNTRTTACFSQMYLKSLGMDITNDVFKENALYYRNCLVRANYANLNLGITEDMTFIKNFYKNLLDNKKIEKNENKLFVLKLKNDGMDANGDDAPEQ